ncbi:MAG: DNA polymerase III subunit delta [Pseudomonadota bacterium]|nr:DNA polymerase III subunit delta [Pseudomonadota bacterium]
MRIKSEQLGKMVQKHLAPVYLLFGDEPFIVQECRDLIRCFALEKGYTEREVLDVETGFDWGRLAESKKSLSLFGRNQLIEVNVPSGKLGSSGTKALSEWCQNLSPDVLLVLLLPRLDKVTQKAKWFADVESVGVCVQANTVARSQLPLWISERLLQQKQYANQETLLFLADLTEGNLLAAWQEIQKLGLLYPSGKIEYDMVRQSVLPVARYAPFDLMEAVLSGESLRAVRILDSLEQEEFEPVILMWTLTRDLRTMMGLVRLLKSGMSMNRAIQALHVWSSRAIFFERALHRIRPSVLSEAMYCAADIDRQIKGLAVDKVWEDLVSVCLLLCQGKKVGKVLV